MKIFNARHPSPTGGYFPVRMSRSLWKLRPALPARSLLIAIASIKNGPASARDCKCEVFLIRRKKQSTPARTRKNVLTLQPHCFVLCERASGTVRFRVDAEPGGKMPADQLAGLMAMHCLVRGQSPDDFEVLVVPRESLLGEVTARAESLLTAGRALGAGVKISRREQQVLEGVIQNLGNKEIATRLHVAERTVKFYVSSLLAKYGVSDRVALTREVLLARSPTQYPDQTLFGYPVRTRNNGENVNARAAEDSSSTVMRGRRHALTLVPCEQFAT